MGENIKGNNFKGSWTNGMNSNMMFVDHSAVQIYRISAK